MTIPRDEQFMRAALELAAQAEAAGEIPIGAVVVHENTIVGRGHNRNLLDLDPTGHAELVALREAGKTLHNHRLGECEMFVTIEPCAMCAGAIIHARLKRLTFAAFDAKAGAVQSVMQVLNHPQLNHQMEVTSGVLAAECSGIVQEFFRKRRAGKA